MFAVLALLFLVVPFLELFVLIQVGQLIGAWYTIAALVLVSVVGTYLVRREGLGVLQRAQAQIRAGQVPGAELVDGVMILLGGALLVTPGFLTDLLGLLLLLPPVRRGLRALSSQWLARRAGRYLEGGRPPPPRW